MLLLFIKPDPNAHAVHLAVIAHIRHRETGYDNLLAQGFPRYEARSDVRHRVDQVLDSWK